MLRFVPLSLFVFCLFTLSSGCSADPTFLDSPEGSSVVKDLPVDRLPPAVVALNELSDAELENRFLEGLAPEALPEGAALGLHRISRGNQASVPWILTFAALKLWHRKVFVVGAGQSEGAHLVDELRLPDRLELVRTHAVVEMGTLEDHLQRHYPDELAANPDVVVDRRSSLITNYSAWSYGGKLDAVMRAAKGWIDEFRVVDPQQPRLLLGRSTYKGRLWCYVILELASEEHGR